MTSGENLKPCPFCGEPVDSWHFLRYDWWVCGCHNENCLIHPTTVCKNTKEEAEKEWQDAFVV